MKFFGFSIMMTYVLKEMYRNFTPLTVLKIINIPIINLVRHFDSYKN